MIVVIQPVLAEVRYENVRPAVVVVVAYSDSCSPTAIRDACLFRHIRKCSIVVVVKESGMGWLGLSIHGVKG